MDNKILINKKFADALLSAPQNPSQVPTIQKVIETIIYEGCLVDQIYPPIPKTIQDADVHQDPNDPYKYFVSFRYNPNLGPAISIGIAESVPVQTTRQGYGVTYFFPIKFMFEKSEEEIRMFEHDILDQVIVSIQRSISDLKDKIFFHNTIAKLVRDHRNVSTEGVDRAQFIDANYFKQVKGIPDPRKVIIESSTVPDSFTDASENYHVGTKELIKTVKDKLYKLQIRPGQLLIPHAYWNGLSTWDFGGAGVVTLDIFMKGIENLYGTIMMNLPVKTTTKYVEIPEGYTGEVNGYINVNVLGTVNKGNIDTTLSESEKSQIATNATMGYLLPAESMFGLNYNLLPSVTKVESTTVGYNKPYTRLYVEVYTAMAIGLSRAYIGFPARFE